MWVASSYVKQHKLPSVVFWAHASHAILEPAVIHLSKVGAGPFSEQHSVDFQQAGKVPRAVPKA